MRLFRKYDVPVPRYTSYPTVPHWQNRAPDPARWLASIDERLKENRDISLYLHLPFCEQLCTYCGCNKRITKNHAVEHPYVDALLAELSLYLDGLHLRPRLKELHLGGGTPTFFSTEQLSRLMDGITERIDVAPGPNFSFEAHPYSTTREQLDLLAGHGFNRISIGVQDFNENIMRIINRRQTTEDVERTVRDARTLGYRINFDLIYGLPTQTVVDILRSVEHVNRLRPDRIAFYGYAHVPWFSPGQRAYSEDDLPKGADRWQLYQKGRDWLEAAGYRDIGLDHFSLPSDELTAAYDGGRLHRNFMGYTTVDNPVTIALGCSAIGDSWTHYVQNEKKVETYQTAVLTEKRLPLLHGHALTPCEQTVRRHILNLMCKGHTGWRSEGDRCEALERAVAQWDEMALDGIVRRNPYRVEVTEAGRPFLRNICLPLDDHYWRRRPTAPTYSRAV
jgi:oxygen-independent coproporphyrinogen-3 oxidase